MGKYKLEYIDEPQEKKKRKTLVTKEREEKKKANIEAYGIWEKFKADYIEAYKYKVCNLTDQQLEQEIILHLSYLTTYTSHFYALNSSKEREYEEEILSKQMDRSGWMVFSVRNNKMLKARTAILLDEYTKRNLTFSLNSMMVSHSSIIDKLKIYSLKFDSVINTFENLPIMGRAICDDCQAIKSECVNSLNNVSLLIQMLILENEKLKNNE
jgi:hypothetical protein